MSPRTALFCLMAAASLWAPSRAQADVAPARPIAKVAPAPRDPVGLARRDGVVAAQLELARQGGKKNETAVQVALGGQCGFAGCSQSTLVAFTFRSQGANTTTQSVLALVSCGPVGDSCTVSLAEVRPQEPGKAPPGKPQDPGKTPPVKEPGKAQK